MCSLINQHLIWRLKLLCFHLTHVFLVSSIPCVSSGHSSCSKRFNWERRGCGYECGWPLSSHTGSHMLSYVGSPLRQRWLTPEILLLREDWCSRIARCLRPAWATEWMRGQSQRQCEILPTKDKERTLSDCIDCKLEQFNSEWREVDPMLPWTVKKINERNTSQSRYYLT